MKNKKPDGDNSLQKIIRDLREVLATEYTGKIKKALDEEDKDKFENKVFPEDLFLNFPADWQNDTALNLLKPFETLLTSWKELINKKLLWVNFLIWTDVDDLPFRKENQHHFRVVLFDGGDSNQIKETHKIASLSAEQYVDNTLSLTYLIYPHKKPDTNDKKPNVIICFKNNLPTYNNESIIIDADFINGQGTLKSFKEALSKNDWGAFGDFSKIKERVCEELNKLLEDDDKNANTAEKFWHYLIWLRLTHPNLSYYYVFPSVIGDQKEGIFGINVGTTASLSEAVFDYIDLVSNLIGGFFELGIRDYRSDMRQKEIKSYARKAAINQVFARQVSHNIGSHVLSRLLSETHINELSKKESTCEVLSIIKSNQCKTSQASDEKNITSEKIIADFNAYIKARLDFLADIATTTPLLETPKWLYKEVLSGLDKNRLLLNHISGIDDFSYSITVKNCLSSSCSDIGGKNGNFKDDIMVSMPNDVMGCHALYVIIENLIRNTAKHSGESKVDFCMEIYDCEEDGSFYEVLLYDNVDMSKAITEDSKKEEWENAYEATFDKSITSMCDWRVMKQNKMIDQAVLDPQTNALRQNSWGMIEMDACAAYLRKVPIEDLDHEDYDLSWVNPEYDLKNGRTQKALNLLKVVKVERGNEQYLGYRFYLVKPKEYLVVGNFDGIDEEKKRELFNKGIKVQSPQDFDPETDIYPHQFLLYEVTNGIRVKIFGNKKYASNRTSLPSRIVELNDQLKESVCTGLANENPLEKLNKIIWPEWIKLFNNMPNKQYQSLKIGSGLNSDEIALNDPITINLEELDESKKFNAVLTHHGKNWNKLKKKFKKGNVGFVNYCEPLSSNAQSILPNVNNNGQPQFGNLQDETKKNKCAEFIISKIGVVDERIQQSLSVEYSAQDNGKIKLEEIYKMTGVVVPDLQSVNGVNLSAADFINNEENGNSSVKSNLEKWFCEHINALDALIIHLGILEKLLRGKDTGDQSISRYINNKILSHKSDLILILTSGRGQPHNLPAGFRFVNLSAVTNCLIEDRSKYKLHTLVFSARKPQ